MNGAHFDTWTRRQFGLATGAALAAALGSAADDAIARNTKKKRRKKRRRRLLQTCMPGRKKKRCCNSLHCQGDRLDPDFGACCRRAQATCATDQECCGVLLCKDFAAAGGLRCCKPPLPDESTRCVSDDECCPGSGCFKEDSAPDGFCKPS